MALPASGRSNVDRIWTAVVLPAPLWPSSAQTVPVGTENPTSCSAGTSAERLGDAFELDHEGHDTAAGRFAGDG